MANEVYCPHCTKEYDRPDTLFDDGSNDEALAKCSRCGKGFTVVQRFVLEWFVKDLSEIPRKCPRCGSGVSFDVLLAGIRR